VAEQPRRRRSLLADLRPLRESPPFRRLLIGSTVSWLGSSMTSFALVLQTYELTRSSVAVGAIGLAQAIPALVVGLFGGSPQTLGLLSTALAAGGLLGSVLSGPAGRVPAKARAMLVTVVIWGAAITCFGFARVFWLALLLLVLAGAADTTTVIFRGSIVQHVTPDRLRGRITAVDYVVGAGSPGSATSRQARSPGSPRPGSARSAAAWPPWLARC
jgi:MFS family permease